MGNLNSIQTISEFMSETETDLARIVHFSSNSSVTIPSVFTTQTKFSIIIFRRPC